MIGKQPLVIGNWKNALSIGESVRLAQSLSNELAGSLQTEVVVAPSFLALASVSEVLRDTRMVIAAQAIGADRTCTGEVTAEQAMEAGATYAIIGHSERRMHNGETDESVAHMVLEASGAQLIPIVCIGETKKERQANRTRAVLRRQLIKGLAKLKSSDPLVIAYEPVWAIGAKKPASVKIVGEAHAIIRDALGRSARIIYGGAVDGDSVKTLIAQPLVDGFLVGRASLDAAQFHAIIQAYEMGN